MSGDITYVHGGVADLAHSVGTTASQLMEIHDQVLDSTTKLQPFFEGEAGTAFTARQMQILRGLNALIETVTTHGSKIMESTELAHALDVNIAGGF